MESERQPTKVELINKILRRLSEVTKRGIPNPRNRLGVSDFTPDGPMGQSPRLIRPRLPPEHFYRLGVSINCVQYVIFELYYLLFLDRLGTG